MRFTNIFMVTINFLIAVFIIFFGGVVTALALMTSLQQTLMLFLLDNQMLMALLGGGLSLVGLFLLLHAAGKRRRYYHIRTGLRAVAVDPAVLNGYVARYWRRLFGRKDIASQVVISGDKFHIIADLPPYPFEEQKTLIQRIEKELTKLFAEAFDYHKGLALSISFQTLKPTPRKD